MEPIRVSDIEARHTSARAKSRRLARGRPSEGPRLLGTVAGVCVGNEGYAMAAIRCEPKCRSRIVLFRLPIDPSITPHCQRRFDRLRHYRCTYSWLVSSSCLIRSAFSVNCRRSYLGSC